MASIPPETEAKPLAHLNEMLTAELAELRNDAPPPRRDNGEERHGRGEIQPNLETPNAKQD